MFRQITEDEYQALAKSSQRVALYRELTSDEFTPITIFQAIKQKYKNSTLLESSPKENPSSRYSYICFDEIASVETRQAQSTITQNGEVSYSTAPFQDVLRRLKKYYQAKTNHELSGFVGGMVGFISYDGVRLFEDIPASHAQDDKIPHSHFRCYRHNITFDHQQGKLVITTVIDTEKQLYQDGVKQLADIEDLIRQPVKEDRQTANNDSIIHADVEDDEFKNMVKIAKSHIKQGDVFQVVLSRQFSKKTTVDAFNIYRSLRFCSPSPYMFYLEGDGYEVIGASPEKLVSVREGVVETRPLAGTRPRLDKGQDQEMEADLLGDEKEIAEHMMLVDLCRNDVGEISKPGTVNVTRLLEIEHFSHVMHISSTVQGLLAEHKDALDAVRASFPAGTLSGAPKIRAMEIIDALETTSRGIYGGVICAFDSKDNVESCIAIRMATMKDGVVSVRTGAGIVHDSDPQSEADETRHKARSVLEAIRLAEEQAPC